MLYTMCRVIIILVEVLLLCSKGLTGGTTSPSKACYAPSNCSQHMLQCGDGKKITVSDAYNMETTDCGNSSDCSVINENPVRRQFSDIHLGSLDRACTAKRDCEIAALHAVQLLSVIHYQCIEDESEINMCTGQSMYSNHISMYFENITSDCSCHVTNDQTVNLDVYLLGMSLPNTTCTKLNVFFNGKENPYNCSLPLKPHRLLASGTFQNNFETRIDIQNPGNGRIWIQINGSTSFTVICGGKVPEKRTTSGAGVNAGAVAGGVVATILIVLAVVVLLLWFRCRRKRNSKSDPPSGVKTDENYSMASPFPDHNYHEIEPPKKQSLNNYDYATADGGLVNTGQENKSQSEDDYDRIGDQPSGNGKPKTDNKTLGYDTTASAAEALQKFRNKKISNQDNYYGYNHLGVNQQSKVLPDDYDTTASAAKVVAQMEANDQVEDDYDGTTTTASPYDIAEHNGQQTGDY